MLRLILAQRFSTLIESATVKCATTIRRGVFTQRANVFDVVWQ
jgi:hypothetical protein